MRLLQVIGTLDPAWGGPAEALLQTTRALKDLGHESEAATLDRPDAQWLGGFPGVVHALGPGLGKYRYTRRLVPWLSARAGDYDAVLVHGIWQFPGFAVWLASRSRPIPYFLFVHGALDPWFKRAYPLKHVKKWLYWPWAEYRVLRDARAVLFTSEEERVLARRSFRRYRANEEVIGFGVADPGGDPNAQRERFFRRYPSLGEKRLLLFLGRIHRKKGCDLLVEAFARAGMRDPGLHLVMAGPDQEGSQRDLATLARARGVEDRITFTGMLAGDMKWGALHAADAFVLPSHSENFGIAVVEALACGLPVLITDKVNIWREIVRDGAGFAEPDTLEGTVALLERWLGLPGEEILSMRARAKACFESWFGIRRAAKTLVDLIERNRAPEGAGVGLPAEPGERAQQP